MDYIVYVASCDEMTWLLPGFAYLFTRYWSKDQYAAFVGSHPAHMPENFAVHKIRKENLYTDRLIAFLKSTEERLIILMNGNDWIRQPVNARAVSDVYEWAMKNWQHIMKIDLSGERARCKTARRWKCANPRGVELVYTPPGSEGLLTFSPAIWNREMLLQVLFPGETQAQAEIGADYLLANKTPGAVMGTQSTLIDCIQVRHDCDRPDTKSLAVSAVDYMRHCGYLRRNGKITRGD